ncbi:toprim domain-containing protein [Methylobacterium sp. E-041]|uniref:DUF7146 domain-containing protein n=1 Tax=unclassified Methylobacterium TaxID=2615210 RepID=UPI001FBADEDA|nr:MULTISPECIES: toprim domain-containing protein [unclassified Methylobacterium]MCJ2037615.1 toprim domain-containing protein [Methylobacterium sp. J-059]MCJ2105365.1 toprim domain-containing protein [Methylobacterium sp. E-041]
MTLREMAHALGGEVAGHQVLCPGPGHSARDRSVTVRPGPESPDGLRVHSHAGDDWRAVKDYIAGRLGLGRERRGQAKPAPAPLSRVSPRAAGVDADRRRRALGVWYSVGNPTGTLVERYLASRGLDLPATVAGEVLRFHAACAFGEERLPVMVAALRCVRTDQPQAVHRTALAPDGTKVGRKMFGPAGGAAVKLDPDDAVTRGLAIGEGVETCLAARQLGILPAWALGSVGAIRTFPVLPGIEALTILCETDDGGASAAAARECGARWHAAGRDVILATPRVPGDMNDAIREARR